MRASTRWNHLVVVRAPWRSWTRAARSDAAGFTLLELTLVLVILAIMLTVIVPRLRNTDRARLESQVRKLAVMARFLRHEAILNGRTYRLNYSVDEASYWVTSADGDDDSGTFVAEEGMLARPVVLPEPVAFADLVLPDTFGQIQEGAGFTDFYPDGYVDCTLLHVGNGQDVYSIYIDSMTGHVSVAVGYHALPSL
jgi:prepilin-type N-terminal cleavage/methylation domain-containing protein